MLEKKNILLALVGMPGSGKSSIVNLLEEEKWNSIRFGEITMIELHKRKMAINEFNERQIREELREEHGKEAFAKLSIPRITSAIKEKNTIIDGLYSWAEYKLLKEKIDIDFKTILVFADKEIRYKRLMNRKLRPLNRDEAISRDLSEIENLEKGGPIAFADYVLLNNDTMYELEQNFIEILEKISAL